MRSTRDQLHRKIDRLEAEVKRLRALLEDLYRFVSAVRAAGEASDWKRLLVRGMYEEIKSMGMQNHCAGGCRIATGFRLAATVGGY